MQHEIKNKNRSSKIIVPTKSISENTESQIIFFKTPGQQQKQH